MAKILDIPTSGSIGAKTHSHNRAGQYIRARRTPTQPVGTGRRAAQRANFGAASSGWGTLTFAQQAAWAAYADAHPITDRLGQSIKLTGQQAYVSIGAQLLNVDLALATAPPISAAVFAVGVISLTAVSAGAITLTLPGLGGADDFMLISFSAPKSSGTTFCKTFWQQSVQAGDTGIPFIVTAAYQAQFGVPAVGKRIFYKITPVNQYGVTGVPVIGFASVT